MFIMGSHHYGESEPWISIQSYAGFCFQILFILEAVTRLKARMSGATLNTPTDFFGDLIATAQNGQAQSLGVTKGVLGLDWEKNFSSKMRKNASNCGEECRELL